MLISLDSIILPDDLTWIDEIQWTPVMQAVEYSATGALLIQESTKLSGRQITLTGAQNMGWITRAMVDALVVKRDTVGLEMTLTIGGSTKNVMFRQGENPVDVAPVLDGNFFDSEDWYQVNSIKLMEVSA